MISLEDYLMRRDVEYPLSSEQMVAAEDIVAKLAQLETVYGEPLILTSGYRPDAIDLMIPGAHRGDAHSKCMGVDLHDPDGALSQWCENNLDVLITIGFWMEAPQSAIDHCHLQTYPPASKKRIFIA